MTTAKRTTPRKHVNAHFIGVNVDAQTLRRLDRIASEENASRSFIIRRLLTDMLEQYEAQRKTKS